MTRMMWIVILVLLVGALLLLMVRSARPGTGTNRLLADIRRAHDELVAQYPNAQFMIQSASPAPRVRNLVVFIVPGKADSAAAERMADSALIVARNIFDLRGFDSVIVALNGVAVRGEPTR